MTADVLSKVPTDLFIGGTWRAASEGGRFDVTDPATGDVVGSVPDAGEADVSAAIDAASAAFEPWRSLSPEPEPEPDEPEPGPLFEPRRPWSSPPWPSLPRPPCRWPWSSVAW